MSSFRQLMMRSKGGGSGGTINGTILGTPTISDDFIISDMAFESSGLKFVLPVATNFRMRIKFKVTNTGPSAIFSAGPGADQKNFRFSLGGDGTPSNTINFLCAGTGGSFGWATYPNNNTGVTYTVANEWWWVEFGYDGTKFFIDKSLDGTTFTNVWTLTRNSTLNLSLGTEIISGDSNLYVDLKECKLWEDGNLVWQGVI